MKLRRIIVTVFVACLTLLAIKGYEYLSTPVIPVFPDIENADGTIDYTLVGVEFLGREMRPIAYNKMVVRLDYGDMISITEIRH
jgi:hypothetical protein